MKVNNPLLRFYFALAITLLLLIFSVDQIFESAQSDQPPVIDAALVLQNVQQLTAKNRPIRCDAQSKSSCDGALFVEYPAEYWAGALPTNEQPLFELTDSQGKRMLCLTDNSDKLLCINRIDWPASAEFTLDLVYLFYFLLFLILFLFSRSLFNDIEILRNSALDEIKFGKFPKFSLSSRSYLQPLAESLRNLTTRIEHLNRFQAEMAETVCHDIKTPLARLKFINHMSKQETLAQSKGQIENNLNDIEANIYDYLRLAKNEYREQPLNITSTELLREVKALTEVFIEDKDRTIHLNIAEGIVINADIKLLARAITNLVSNALRFCQHNIWITASVEHKTLLLAVEDDGLGWDQTSSNDDIIPEHHQIGLAVVRRVTEQHDGQMAISKSVYGGAKVALHLPIVMSQ